MLRQMTLNVISLKSPPNYSQCAASHNQEKCTYRLDCIVQQRFEPKIKNLHHFRLAALTGYA